jgi:hypothetical protein
LVFQSSGAPWKYVTNKFSFKGGPTLRWTG